MFGLSLEEMNEEPIVFGFDKGEQKICRALSDYDVLYQLVKVTQLLSQEHKYNGPLTACTAKRPEFKNCDWVKWVRESTGNLRWILRYHQNLLVEYKLRTGNSAPHQVDVFKLMIRSVKESASYVTNSGFKTRFPVDCLGVEFMPEYVDDDNVLWAYRGFYLNRMREKQFLSNSIRARPLWFRELGDENSDMR